MSVVLFSAQSCHRCRAVERHLTKLDVEYTKVMVDEDPQTADSLKSRGFNGLPVVKIGDDWSEGYHPDMLDQLFKPAKVPA